MASNIMTQKIPELFKKYRYAILIILIGIILMMIPAKQPEQSDNTVVNHIEYNDDSLEERLSSILSLIEGAGEVKVILTTAAGEETIYQTNELHRSGETQLDTVITTATDRGEYGLIKQINPQIYLGAVIVCSGANDPKTRLSIVDAVSKLTGLGANDISVLKMK